MVRQMCRYDVRCCRDLGECGREESKDRGMREMLYWESDHLGYYNNWRNYAFDASISP